MWKLQYEKEAHLKRSCSKTNKKSLIVRALKGQVDLMDFQSNPDGNYKFIMVYQDHLTKFCNIKPLTSKKASEVAFNLIDVFTIFVSPHILQSDNGREFTVLVISELKLM